MKFFFLMHQDLKKGILFILLGWLSISLMYTLSKFLGDQSTVVTQVFFRNLVGVIFVLPWILKKPSELRTKNFTYVVIRSLSGLATLFFLFLAIQKISIVNTTLLSNTSPFFVPFILWLWLKSPIEHKLWPGVVIGFLGIALILNFDRNIFSVGGIYALLSGVCLALTTVALRLTSRRLSLFPYLFYFYLISLIGTVPFTFFSFKVEGYVALLALIGIGFCSIGGQICFYFALRNSKAQYMAPFSYSAVIFSGIFEWLIWRTAPPPLSYVGILLIMGAGVWTIYFSKPSETTST